MDQPKIVRVLQLLMLFADNRYATNEEICQRFGFSERTLFRYIDTFREAGFVIKKNENNVYKLEISTHKLSRSLHDLLHFSEEEALILHSAIDTIEAPTKAKERLKRKLYAVYDYKVIADLAVERKDVKTLHDLQSAIEDRRQVYLRGYRSSHSNTTSDRLVEPYAFTSTYDQIWCYEVQKRVVKTFKISRIQKVDILESKWANELEHRTGYVDIFRMHSTQRFPIKLQLSLRAANLLMEEYPLSSQYMKEIEGNRYVLETEVCSYEGVTRFVLGLYDDIEILGSGEFKDFINYRVKMLNK